MLFRSDEVSAAATSETNALFSSERLARQRAKILHRLERDGRSARLIAFPAVESNTPRNRPAPRWLAGAAAAGLILGLLAGQVVRLPPNGRVAPLAVSQRPSIAVLQAGASTISEEEFLGRIELAIEATTGSSLQPLDDLTPRGWEIAAQ